MVPRYLEQNDGEQSLEDEGEPEDGDYPTVVVCSGELLEQVSSSWGFSASGLSLVLGVSPTQLGKDHLHILPAFFNIRTAHRVGCGAIPCTHYTGRPVLR